MSNVSIIFYCSMLVSYHYYMFLPSSVVILGQFIVLTYWQDGQCQFPIFCCFVFEKILFRKTPWNWTKINGNYSWKEMKTKSGGRPEGPTTVQGQPVAVARHPPAGETHPYHWWVLLASPRVFCDSILIQKNHVIFLEFLNNFYLGTHMKLK